jgi:hypothetical protein
VRNRNIENLPTNMRKFQSGRQIHCRRSIKTGLGVAINRYELNITTKTNKYNQQEAKRSHNAY